MIEERFFEQETQEEKEVREDNWLNCSLSWWRANKRKDKVQVGGLSWLEMEILLQGKRR